MSEQRRVADCVERLCGAGCAQVRVFIAQLEAGEPVPGTEALSVQERSAVLEELRAVMAVYDGRCEL